MSWASKDAPSTGSAPAAHGPPRAATPPPSQDAPSHHPHHTSAKQKADDADKDGAVQSGRQLEADANNSPMES